MAKKILILGASGTGKSTSIMHLDNSSTFIIQCVNKLLPFKGSNKLYSKENKNMFQTQEINKVIGALEKINKNENIKTLIIDDFNYLMTYGYKSKAKENGYAKFETLAFGIMDILETIDGMRDTLTVYIMAHTQKDNEGKLSTKTIGRFLDEKVCIEGLFTITLLALGSETDYKFTVNGQEPAKTPIGMFETHDIENNLSLVNQKIKEYYN